MVRDRGLLGPGVLARSENKRLRNGIAETRPGTNLPPDFNPPFGNQLIGSGIYSNPNGDEVMMVAPRNSGFVWALQHNKDPRQILIIGGATVPGKPEVVAFGEALPRATSGGGCQTRDGVDGFSPVSAQLLLWWRLIPPATCNGIPLDRFCCLIHTSQPSWRDQFI
jgi:hypothetical protein